jgi:succinylarginine dihydrolase
MTSTHLLELNFDGLVGPTHNYAGLSYGNVASAGNAGAVSRPRDAALQGLAKMRRLLDLGLTQGILPPHERPHVPTLRALGYEGDDPAVLARAAAEDPVLLAQVCSASAMWTANAATVSPSHDTADHRVHFTPANLRAMFHRSIEPPVTSRILTAIFPGDRFAHHPALPSADAFGDEGAANHTRLFDDSDSGNPGPGAHLFVYGTHFGNRHAPKPRLYPARQTLQASQAIARLHRLDLDRAVFAQQNPDVIDEGVFHNDVIAVGNGRVLFYHERAFASDDAVLSRLESVVGPAFTPVRVADHDAPVDACVRSYLFNSQLVTLPDATMALIAPTESYDDENIRGLINRLVADPANPIAAVHYLNLRESMRNGGGPACLRLRVPLSPVEIAAVNPNCLATPERLDELEAWVMRHYPEELRPTDLADPALITRTRDALNDLTKILALGSVYDFQR